MRILANLLIGAGLLGVAMAYFVTSWLVNLACDMNTTGCRTDGATLFWRFIGTGESFFFFWLPILLSVGLFVLGLRLRRVDKPAPSP